LAVEKLFLNAKTPTDAYIILSPINRRYYTGFLSSFGCLLASKTESVFITDYRYTEDARQVIEKDIRVIAVLKDNFNAILIRELKSIGAKTVAFEDNRTTYAEFLELSATLKDFTLIGLGAEIDYVRAIKTEAELGFIAAAQAINDKLYSKMLNFFKAGYSEIDCKIELEYQMARLGATGTAFDTIMAFGQNTSKPHSVPSNKKLENGDLIMMDYGARVDGYCSDITRTVSFGRPKADYQKIYDIVLQAQRYAITNIKQGVLCNEIDSLAREYISANNYKDNFNHGLGHSVGLEIHENPGFTAKCGEFLKKNMVLTVEPGIYIEGTFGIRIEDLIIVQEQGQKNLTASDKDTLTII
jgi:Xaa-Pro aminopeptidase